MCASIQKVGARTKTIRKLSAKTPPSKRPPLSSACLHACPPPPSSASLELVVPKLDTNHLHEKKNSCLFSHCRKCSPQKCPGLVRTVCDEPCSSAGLSDRTWAYRELVAKPVGFRPIDGRSVDRRYAEISCHLFSGLLRILGACLEKRVNEFVSYQGKLLHRCFALTTGVPHP
jgi:hypothetical protein